MVDVADIMDYESGNMTEEEVINLFQNLVNSGMAWRLQGSYGREAQRLIEAGLVQPRKG